MKTFYVMGNREFKPYRIVSWEDRRKSEVALRYIQAGESVPVEHILKHFSVRLKIRPSRIFK